MTVRIVRLRNGEDIIADVQEVRDRESNEAVAIKFDTPYSVAIHADEYKREVNKAIKLSNPKIEMFPWAPLSKEKEIFIAWNEVLCFYEPHQAVLDQYGTLCKMITHEGEEDDGGGTTVQFTDEDILAPQ